ncbi:MAG: hypothetical protein PHV36_02185 [Elusimicrobiales bacterium]|nr:hypothetical protein [Elusimicrobiales bacterium]
MSYGKGIFLKLNNDTLMHRIDTLDTIIRVLTQRVKDRDIVFFSNGRVRGPNSVFCKNLDSFVGIASFHSTWIGSFGMWRDDFTTIDNFNTVRELRLINGVLFRQISLGKSVWIDNSVIFDSIPPASKSGYNIYDVFVTNYLGLLEDYKAKKMISWLTLSNEKAKLMFRFLIPWTANIWKDKEQYKFDINGGLSTILKKYRFHPSLYIGVVYLPIRMVLVSIKKLFASYIY